MKALAGILDTMSALPLARIYQRLFVTMDNAARMALCGKVGVAQTFDPITCVQMMIEMMANTTDRDTVLHDPWCREFLVDAFKGNMALQKPNPSG